MMEDTDMSDVAPSFQHYSHNDVAHHLAIPIYPDGQFLTIKDDIIVLPHPNNTSHRIAYIKLNCTDDVLRTIEFYGTEDKILATVFTYKEYLEDLAKHLCDAFLQTKWYRTSMYREFCNLLEEPDANTAFKDLFLLREVCNENRLAMYRDYYITSLSNYLRRHTPEQQCATRVWTCASNPWSGFRTNVDASSYTDKIKLLLNFSMMDRYKRSEFIKRLMDFNDYSGDISSLASTLRDNDFFKLDNGIPSYEQKDAIVARIIVVLKSVRQPAQHSEVFAHAKNLLVSVIQNSPMVHRPDIWGQFALNERGNDWEFDSLDEVQEALAQFEPPVEMGEQCRPILALTSAPELKSEDAAAINTITRLMRATITTVQAETVVYRLTTTDNPPKMGLRSVTVVPSNTGISGWTGTVYKIILKPGVKVITAPLLDTTYGNEEFEMIVVDGVIDPVATSIAGGNTLVVKDSDSGEAGEKHGAKRRRTEETPTLEPLFLRLRIA